MRGPSSTLAMMDRAGSIHGSMQGPTRGFSLVELMVAIALSLLLLTGVVAIFASSRASYDTTEQLSRVQETGRFALEELARQIRSAGFSGCSRQPNYVSTALNNSSNLLWDFSGGAVVGFDATASGWTPALPAGVVSSAGSDVLVVRAPRADAAPARVTTDMLSPEDPLVVAGGSPIAVDDVVMAYSCEGQSFFQVTGLTGGLQHAAKAGATSGFLPPGNATSTTSFPFRLNAEVVPVETIVYSIRPSQSVAGETSPPEGMTSLWRHRSGRELPEEVIEGVEMMQVEYGIDSDGDRVVDTYQPATATTDWTRVLAVRIGLLIRTIDEYGTDTDQRTYQVLGTTVNAKGDRRTREVFTSTVSIRNRVRVD